MSKIAGVDEVADKLSKCEIIEPTFNNPTPHSNNSSPAIDPAKRLKNLRKKLREIETLEEKIKLGSLINPDKDQKEKLSKKKDILGEIEKLEKSSGDSSEL